MRVIVGDNELGPDGIKHIAVGLASNQTVKILNLSTKHIIMNIGGSNISVEGSIQLSKALKVNKSLISLQLGNIISKE